MMTLSPGLSIAEALSRAQKVLQQSLPAAPGFDAAPRLDAEVLLSFVLGQDRVFLYREFSSVLSDEKAQAFGELVRRRALGEPVAYLTGSKEFMGLDFTVGPHVLIPRPETELMVELAREKLLQLPPHRRVAVDVGTGSGAVAVSLACLVPGARVYATDICDRALKIAAHNAGRHRVEVNFSRGDLLTHLIGEDRGTFPLPSGQGKHPPVFPPSVLLAPNQVAVITANLPYLPSGTIADLPRDVRDYEPSLALDGGFDGLSLYRRLVPQAAGLLAPGGYLLLEITPGQSQSASALLPEPDWQTRVLPDLAGLPRVVVGRRSSVVGD